MFECPVPLWICLLVRIAAVCILHTWSAWENVWSKHNGRLAKLWSCENVTCLFHALTCMMHMLPDMSMSCQCSQQYSLHMEMNLSHSRYNCIIVYLSARSESRNGSQAVIIFPLITAIKLATLNFIISTPSALNKHQIVWLGARGTSVYRKGYAKPKSAFLMMCT